MKYLRGLQDSVKQIEQMFTDYEDIGLLIEMSEEEPDDDTIQEIQEDLERFKEEFEEFVNSKLKQNDKNYQYNWV